MSVSARGGYSEHERELLQWLSDERVRIGALLTDYEAGKRKVSRIENGRLIDETEQEINNLKQRTAQIGLLIAGF
jgi:hypothetical protein